MTPLAERLARSLPGASFELEALVRLVGIHETTDVPTASVSCGVRTRLRVNPEFAAEYCSRDEHLFLLVMHEMWHVLLGHTTLYGRPGILENIAFDALINAGLSRQHPQPEYRGFFERLNPPDTFPSLLLRPPVGWPRRPKYSFSGPSGTKELMMRLYPPPGKNLPEPTYQEVIELIRKANPSQAECARVKLLGEHDDPDSNGNPMLDDDFAEAIREIVGNWPPPPRSLAGRDTGGKLMTSWVESTPASRTTRDVFLEVLKEVLVPQRTGFQNSRRVEVQTTLGPGPLPNFADRTLLAKRRLLGENVLPNQPGIIRYRLPDRPTRALVYFDVSGSMSSILPQLLGLLAPLASRGQVQVRQFSTVVSPVPPDALLRGRVDTTVGTDIRCVLEDILSRTIDRVLILTDGYVGQANADQVAALASRGIKVVSVLPADGWATDLEPYSTIHKLPGLEATS
jgi:hypothetical protein